MFIRFSTSEKITVLIVYMDDIILIGDDSEEVAMATLKEGLSKDFRIRDLGKLPWHGSY